LEMAVNSQIESSARLSVAPMMDGTGGSKFGIFSSALRMRIKRCCKRML